MSPVAGAFSVLYANAFPVAGAAPVVLGPEWELYQGPGHAGWGLRRPSAISVVDDADATRTANVLRLRASMGSGAEAGLMVSGGMKLKVPVTYGRVRTRVRVGRDPDEVTSGVMILWPSVGPRWPTEPEVWPAGIEIDVWETYGARATRTPVETNINRLAAGVRHGPPFTEDDRELYHVEWAGVDGSSWHVVEFTWLPDRLTLAVDGGAPVEVADESWIPHWDHELTFQLDGFDAPHAPGRQPALSEGNSPTLDVDWVELHRWDP